MREYPLACHITWGAYGARLSGSSKPHVDRDHNQWGTLLPPADPEWEAFMRKRMTQDPVSLTLEQRVLVEAAISDLANRYQWTIHAVAAQSDHVHVVLTAPREGSKLRDALKAVATRALNKRFGLRKWWAEGGSAKYLWEEEYFGRARDYVRRQRDF